MVVMSVVVLMVLVMMVVVGRKEQNVVAVRGFLTNEPSFEPKEGGREIIMRLFSFAERINGGQSVHRS